MCCRYITVSIGFLYFGIERNITAHAVTILDFSIWVCEGRCGPRVSSFNRHPVVRPPGGHAAKGQEEQGPEAHTVAAWES